MRTQVWVQWAQRLQAIAQTGLTWVKDPWDRERYEQVRSIAAEIMTSGAAGEQTSELIDFFRREAGYATPKVDIRTAVFNSDEQVLLVREREDGGWTLPGGWADVGTSPALNAIREVREESGFEVELIKLAAVYDRNLHGHPPIPFHVYKLFFIARLTGGSAMHSVETDSVEFFAESHLPPLSATRVTAAQIGQMFQHHRHPEWPASFD